MNQFQLRLCVATIMAATLAACVAPPTRTAPTPISADPVQTIIDDMSLPHEAKLHGVPDNYDWSRGPRLGRGNNPGDFKAFTAWGQVYESATGNPAVNTRVELRHIASYVLSKRTGKWVLLQHTKDVDGGAFKEDFANNTSTEPQARRETDGTVSVTAGGGYNYHFWPSSGRATIDPDDVAGVFTTVQARLILDDPAKPDDRASAQYLLGMGGDYWLSLTAEWKSDWSTVGDAGIGRMKFVTPVWQSFNMITLTADDVRKNPPPI